MKMCASIPAWAAYAAMALAAFPAEGIASFFNPYAFAMVTAAERPRGFERSSRIQSLIFNVDIGKFPAGQHGSEAFTERDRISLWHHFGVTPHTWTYDQLSGMT